MNKYCYFPFQPFSCLFFLLLTLCVQSSFSFAGGSSQYSYYELSKTDSRKLVIKINKKHSALDITQLSEHFQINVRSISPEEAALTHWHIELQGGVITSSLDGNLAQRGRIEADSVANILRAAVSLYFDASHFWGMDASANHSSSSFTLEVDFLFRLDGHLGSMMLDVHRALSDLQARSIISGYTIRRIESSVGRRGSLLIGVDTLLPQSEFAQQLSSVFAGFFIFRNPDSSLTRQPDCLQQILESMATGNVAQLDTIHRTLTGQLKGLSQPDYRSLQARATVQSGQEAGAVGRESHLPSAVLYLYQVVEQAENRSSTEPFYVFSGDSNLASNPAQLPYHFIQIRNANRFLSRTPVIFRNTWVMSGLASIAVSEMSIYTALLRRGQVVHNSLPQNFYDHVRFYYRLSFAQIQGESEESFVERVTDSLDRLSRGSFFEYIVSGISVNDQQMTVLSVAYYRYVRASARYDDVSRRFLIRARADPAVTDAFLMRDPALILTEGSGVEPSCWAAALRWLACCFGGRLCVRPVATDPELSYELQNRNPENPSPTQQLPAREPHQDDEGVNEALMSGPGKQP